MSSNNVHINFIFSDIIISFIYYEMKILSMNLCLFIIIYKNLVKINVKMSKVINIINLRIYFYIFKFIKSNIIYFIFS